MKKAIYILAFIFVSQFSVFAQKTKVGYSGGLGGGIAITNFKTENATTDAQSNTGLTMGIVWDVPLKSNFSFQPSINYIRKGNHEDLYSGYESRLTINYFETQFNFVYHVGENGNLFFGAGPSAVLALNGKETLTKAGKEEVIIIKFGGHSTDDMQRYDFGATGLAGYKFGKAMFLSVCYNKGFTNLNPLHGENDKVTSNYFAVKAGFLINQ